MVMGSQFSLSLELTKLVPFGSLVNAAGHGFVRLLREIQASGSDFIAEEDLAQVFGRNRVEPLFASTFRTAVKHSVIHEVSSIAELVFEGGAGPTVRRSLNEPAYFAMVVQLSVLTFTHELLSLTRSLSKAFERRSQGATEYVAPPRYDALKGALRAIREQTCGFMWELVLSAVEKRLYPSIAWTDGSLYTLRTIPTVILQGLLDSLTAVQHLPENTYLRISTQTGIPTIVVWAHQILGLSVKVDFEGQSLIFGNGPVSIYIDGDTRGPEIALLNETDDPFFQLVETDADERLLPVRQHPLRDYGTQVIRLRDDNHDRERQLVHDVVTSCVSVARDRGKHPYHKAPEPEQQNHNIHRLARLGRLNSFPSISRILTVSKMVFASNEDVIDAIDLNMELPCAAGAAESHGSTQLLCLTHIVLVLGMVHGLDEQLSLHLDVIEPEQYQPFRIPDARVAYSSLATLLEGQLPRRLTELEIGRTSVVSASGWSLCLGSLACKDPSDAKGLLAFIRGVPARGGERRRYVIDGMRPGRTMLALPLSDPKRSTLILTSGPGEKCVLESWALSEKTRYFIGITDDAFEVRHVLSCKSSKKDNDTPQVDLSTGFRSMQEASWEVIHTPGCHHAPSSLGQSMILPEGVWAFHGFATPATEGLPAEAVFVGLVAGENTLNMLQYVHHRVKGYLEGYQSVQLCIVPISTHSLLPAIVMHWDIAQARTEEVLKRWLLYVCMK
ncbi:MAG: hypothetical protein Q9199_004682 [Rusavskia elegans]